MNSRLKRVAERALVRSGVARMAQARLATSSLLILAYHDIVPTGARNDGASSLHLPQREFARQLDLISITHDVVSLDSAVTHQSTERSRVAITFDDAYVGALTAGVEELQRRQLPATVFVAPALLGRDTWWDIMAMHSAGIVRGDLNSHAMWQLAGRRDQVLAWAAGATTNASLPTPSARIGTLAELESAVAYPRLAVAAHTWSHVNLCAVAADELAREVSLPLDWLSARFRSFVPMISYPYGLSSREVHAAASRAGYSRAFRVDGGWMNDPVNADPFAMPRYNVPAGLSLDGLRLRLAGIGASS